MHADTRRDLMFLMGHINRRWRKVVDRKLQPLGLTEATWLPLLHIARSSEPMRQKDLAASLSLDGSSVVRLLDGLEAAKLVERSEGTDRRAKILQLTPDGHAAVEQVQALVADARAELFAGVTDKELQQASELLGRVSAALSVIEDDENR